MSDLSDMIVELGELAEGDELNEFDRSFVESVVERTSNGRVPSALMKGEADRVEMLYGKHFDAARSMYHAGLGGD